MTTEEKALVEKIAEFLGFAIPDYLECTYDEDGNIKDYGVNIDGLIGMLYEYLEYKPEPKETIDVGELF